MAQQACCCSSHCFKKFCLWFFLSWYLWQLSSTPIKFSFCGIMTNEMTLIFETALIFAFGQSNELLWMLLPQILWILVSLSGDILLVRISRWAKRGWIRRADFSLCKVRAPSANSHKKRQKMWYQPTDSRCCYNKSQIVKIYISITGFGDGEGTEELQGWFLAAALNTRWEQGGGISTKKNAEDIKQSLIKNNAGIWYYLSKLHFTLRLDGELCSASKGTSSERV